MDPRAFQTPDSQMQSGSTEWLPSLLLKTLHTLLGEVGELKANQKANRRDIIDRLEIHQEFHSRQVGDLKLEMLSRLDSHEQSIRALQSSRGQPEAESSMAKSLFGSVGAFLIEVIPWKHVAVMFPWAAIALFGHLMPEQTKAVILKVMEKFAG